MSLASSRLTTDTLVTVPTRVAAHNMAQMLEALERTGSVERGDALLVSLGPIRDKLGPRWDIRRDGVMEHAQKHFEKHLCPGDLWLAVNDTDILIAAPTTAPSLAQGIAYRALKEVLTFFLGRCDEGSLKVDRVTGVGPDGIEARPLSAAELDAARAGPGVTQAPHEQPALALPTHSCVKNWPLRMTDGRAVTVCLALDPVLDVRTSALAGRRVEATVCDALSGAPFSSHQRRQLSPRDAGLIDEAALDRGLACLSAAPASDRPWLILQLSFVGLSNSNVRANLLNRVAAFREQMQRAVICELVDVETGVPAGRLREVASFARPFSRAVFAQIEPCRFALEALLAANLAGATFRAQDLGSDVTSMAEGLRRLGRFAPGTRPVLTVTGLPTADLAIEAMASGFTHATVRAEQPDPAAPSPAAMAEVARAH